MTMPVIGGHRLSVAVELVDAYTGETPQHLPRVRLEHRPEQLVRTPSDRYVLLDLDAAVTAVDVSVEGRGYLPAGTTIEDIEEPDTNYEATSITLTPAPAYRFPSTATLVRGTVTTGDTPLPDATVRLAGPGDDADSVHARSRETRTDADGEFVAFVTGLTDEDVTDAYTDGTDLGHRVVHVDGERPELRVIHPDTGAIEAVPVAIPVGGTASVDVTL